VFIFALVILTGKVIYSQFDTLSLVFSDSPDTELASLAPEFFHQTAMDTGKLADPALALYRSELSRADVLWFYAHITGDEAIARIILDNANRNNIPPALAFALAWEESHYRIKAVNQNATSIDRGLFQLNNKAFPKLTEKDFFNPAVNAQYGLTHLSYCLDLSGNEVAALAMYNAGTTKVRNDKTPKKTLDYVSRILAYREGLDKLFSQQVAPRYTVDDAGEVTAAAKK
jgi:soluble lytic murein transglycosylase-like protein